MKALLFFIYASLAFKMAHAEIVLTQNSAPTHKSEVQGLPTLVYSTTFLSLPPNAVVQSYVLSIFPDGSTNVMRTLDNQRNLALSAKERKVSIQSFGPKILPEQAQAKLQYFFAQRTPWNIPEHAFAVRDPKESGFWMAELTLQFGTSHRHCAISSTEKQNPEIDQNAYAFLSFLEQVRRFICGEKTGKPEDDGDGIKTGSRTHG